MSLDPWISGDFLGFLGLLVISQDFMGLPGIFLGLRFRRISWDVQLGISWDFLGFGLDFPRFP